MASPLPSRAGVLHSELSLNPDNRQIFQEICSQVFDETANGAATASGPSPSSQSSSSPGFSHFPPSPLSAPSGNDGEATVTNVFSLLDGSARSSPPLPRPISRDRFSRPASFSGFPEPQGTVATSPGFSPHRRPASPRISKLNTPPFGLVPDSGILNMGGGGATSLEQTSSNPPFTPPAESGTPTFTSSDLMTFGTVGDVATDQYPRESSLRKANGRIEETSPPVIVPAAPLTKVKASDPIASLLQDDFDSVDESFRDLTLSHSDISVSVGEVSPKSDTPLLYPSVFPSSLPEKDILGPPPPGDNEAVETAGNEESAWNERPVYGGGGFLRPFSHWLEPLACLQLTALQRWVIILTWLVLGIVVSIVIYAYGEVQGRRDWRHVLVTECNHVADFLSEAFVSSVDELASFKAVMEGFYFNSPQAQMNESNFATYSGVFQAARPLIQAVVFGPLIWDSGRAAFEARLGSPILSLDGKSRRNRARYYVPVQFASLAEASFIGRDLLQDPIAEEVMMSAMRSGTWAVSRPSTLFSTSPSPSLGVASCFFTSNSSRPTPPAPESLAATLGFITAMINFEGLVTTVLAKASAMAGVDLKVWAYDTTNASLPIVLYSPPGQQLPSTSSALAGHLTALAPEMMGDFAADLNFKDALRHFELRCSHLHAAPPVPWASLEWSAAMLAFSLLIGAVMHGVLRRIETVKANFIRMERMTKEMTEAKIAAESADEAKTRFLATVSHEIRTPLNGVLGMLQLLKSTQDELTEVQKDYVDTACSSGQQLANLINDVLDFSKIEAGRMDLDARPFDPRLEVDTVLGLFGEKACLKGIELAGLVQSAVPAVLVGDASRFRQVLINLVGNAAKFTEAGHILLTMRVADENEDLRASFAPRRSISNAISCRSFVFVKGDEEYDEEDASVSARRVSSFGSDRRRTPSRSPSRPSRGSNRSGSGSEATSFAGEESERARVQSYPLGLEGRSAVTAPVTRGRRVDETRNGLLQSPQRSRSDASSGLLPPLPPPAPKLREPESVHNNHFPFPFRPRPDSAADSASEPVGNRQLYVRIPPRDLEGSPQRAPDRRANLSSSGVSLASSGSMGRASGAPSPLGTTQYRHPTLSGREPVSNASTVQGIEQWLHSDPLMAREEEQRGKTVRLVIAVEDTGCGIPEGAQAKIFQPFMMIDSSSVRMQGGTGIGLSISHRLVELQGGSMGLVSQPGVGSIFFFDALFPLVASQSPRSRAEMIGIQHSTEQRLPPEAVRLKGKRVLVVESSSVRAQVLASHLTWLGVQPVFASSIGDAMRKLRAPETSEGPMTDIHMAEAVSSRLSERSASASPAISPTGSIWSASWMSPLSSPLEAPSDAGAFPVSNADLSFVAVLADADSSMWQHGGVELGEALQEHPEFASLPLLLALQLPSRGLEAAARMAGFRAFVHKPLRVSQTAAAFLEALFPAPPKTPPSRERSLSRSPGKPPALDVSMRSSSRRAMDPAATKVVGVAPAVVPATGKKVESSDVKAAAPPRRQVNPALSQMLQGKRFLVVDDNLVNRKVASRMLLKYGVTTETVDGGAKAVERMKPGHDFDLVLMDIQMPGMDGYEATKRIREGEQNGAEGGQPHPRVPIVALTADVLQGTKEKCVESGMDGYLTKPIEEDMFFRTCMQFFHAPVPPPSVDNAPQKPFSSPPP